MSDTTNKSNIIVPNDKWQIVGQHGRAPRAVYAPNAEFHDKLEDGEIYLESDVIPIGSTRINAEGTALEIVDASDANVVWHAVGIPGQEPRMIFQGAGHNPEAQVQDGEVLVEIAAKPDNRRLISACGTRLDNRPHDIDELRKEKWIEAKLYRLEFTHDKMWFDAGSDTNKSGWVNTDSLSQTRISLIMNVAIDAKRRKIEHRANFTMYDNHQIELNGDDAIRLGYTLFNFLDECQNASTIIRQKINSATSKEELDKIDIKDGYPNHDR